MIRLPCPPFVNTKLLEADSLKQNKRILICPLDWGLGHATRCIPIIRYLIENEFKVIIAADNRPLELLKKEFPSSEFLQLPGYEVNYSEKIPMIWSIFFSIPRIIKGICREHISLKKIIKNNNIDLVISDNRYGLWSKKIPCVFITHQLLIKSPFAEKILFKINKYFINKYNECWVPDRGGNDNLSGDLAHYFPLQKNTFFIGALSRFSSSLSVEENRKEVLDVMVILSGTEPQRSVFEKIILQQLKHTSLKTLIVRGIPETGTSVKDGNIEIISHLKTPEMLRAILSAKIIIARSGYSTIMDLATLGKKAIFVPTPGQTEQEYLAEYHCKNQTAFTTKQEDFDLTRALEESRKYRGFEKLMSNEEFKIRLDTLYKMQN